MKKEAAYFAQFSTRQLEEMLRLGLKKPDSDHDETLLLIMEVLEERSKDTFIVTEEELDQAWEQFQTYYNIPEGEGVDLYEEDKPIDETKEAPTGKKEAKREEKVVPIRSGGRRRKIPKTVRVAVATLLVTFSSITVVQAAGVDFYGLMATWTNDIFQFQVPETTPTPEQEQASEEMQKEINAIGISEKLAPTWWPERFELYDTIHEKVEDAVDSLTFEYRNQEDDTSFGVFVDVYYDVNLIKNAVFEKDDTPPEQYTSHGRTFFILSNIDTYTATWNDGTIEVTIAGQISRDEIISIIDSIGG